MLNNKKGISTIVTVIILVALVLVVIGIFWSTAIGVVEEQTESVESAQDCLGIVLNIESVTCLAGGPCEVEVKRAVGSASKPIDGVQVTLSNDAGDEVSLDAMDGDTVATKTYTWSGQGIDNPTSGSLRFYFGDSANPEYCSAVTEWSA